MTISFSVYPPVIAHRGASAYAPENTLVAFTKAAQMGVRWVEFDVMQSACGEVVVFHDDTLERTTSGAGYLHQTSFAYLNSLDAGRWFHPQFSGEKIPSLKQVLSFLNDMHISANIEIKCLPGHEEALVKKTLHIIENLPQAFKPTILFSSFSIDALRLLRKYAPNALLGLLLHEWEAGWEDVCTSLHCASVNVYEEIMTEAMAKKIKGMGRQLLCYTVNNKARAIQLYRYGVDAVFSDVPDRILNAWAETFRYA